MHYKQQTEAASSEVIVDLSDLTRPLMEYEDISDMLSDKQEQKLKRTS